MHPPKPPPRNTVHFPCVFCSAITMPMQRAHSSGQFFKPFLPTVTLTLLSCLILGCHTPRPRNPAIANIDAVLWTQTAAEHEAAFLGVYARAKQMLQVHLKDPAFSALDDEQRTNTVTGKPPAVILDLDETVLNNIDFQGECVRRGTNFDATLWKEWVELERATALPGAVDFCRFAESNNVKLTYITNRGEKCTDTERQRQKAATKANLAKLGLPVADDSILMPGDKPEWTTDKTLRRSFVAEKYRVLALIGDDLGDFISVTNRTVEERLNFARKHQGNWGTSWFILPNPMYGSWIRTLTANAPKDPLAAQQWKIEKLPGMSIEKPR